jgi:hypothetical protein
MHGCNIMGYKELPQGVIQVLIEQDPQELACPRWAWANSIRRWS